MSKLKIRLLAVAIFFGIGCSMAQKKAQEEPDFLSRIFKNDPAYLFCYSTPQSKGLVFNYSFDGLLWKKVGNGATYFKPGSDVGGSFIDPSIVRGPDGMFHLVWATDSTKGSIGYACSSDLTTWTKEKMLTVTSGAAQAPELFYHSASKQFFLLWASASNTLYYTTTKDFVTFQPTKPFYEASYTVSDPFVFKKSGSYHLFFKNDNSLPLEKNIRMVSSLNIKKFRANAVEPLTGIEPSKGPSVLKIGKYIYLYYTNYNTNTYRAMRCKSLSDPQWEDATPYMTFPSGNAQGTVFNVDDKTLHDLQSFLKK